MKGKRNGAHEVQPRGSGSGKEQGERCLSRVGRSWGGKHNDQLFLGTMEQEIILICSKDDLCLISGKAFSL